MEGGRSCPYCTDELIQPGSRHGLAKVPIESIIGINSVMGVVWIVQVEIQGPVVLLRRSAEGELYANTTALEPARGGNDTAATLKIALAVIGTVLFGPPLMAGIAYTVWKAYQPSDWKRGDRGNGLRGMLHGMFDLLRSPREQRLVKQQNAKVTPLSMNQI